MEADGLKTVRSDWSDVLLVCRKCSKKLDGGFGPKRRTPLARALRKALALKKGRKGARGIVEIKCLGVCPRGAVTVIGGLMPREWKLVPAGMVIEAVMAELGIA